LPKTGKKNNKSPTKEGRKRMNKKIPLIILYLATIPVANWMISNVGTQYFPGGPHTIPVGFGYNAPSGVLMIGIAMFLRDIVQNVYGRKATLVAIAVGVLLSYAVNPAVATASAIAFACGELADFLVYTKLRDKTLVGAVISSGVIGGFIDSFIFLQIAFGSTMYWQGQVIGKTEMALLGGLLIWISNDLSKRLPAFKS
jgi:uncharacterized PurR-regulated membrane protein YhhQ (DUF165 family)